MVDALPPIIAQHQSSSQLLLFMTPLLAHVDAVYLGPTFYWQITPKILMSAAWEAQIAGREVGVSSALDLTDFYFERARLLP